MGVANKKIIGAIAAVGVVAVIGVAAWGLSGNPAADAVLDASTSAEVVATSSDTSAAPAKPEKDADKKEKDEKAFEEPEKSTSEETAEGEAETEGHPEEVVEIEEEWVDQSQDGNGFSNSNSGGNSTVGGGVAAPSKRDNSGSVKPSQEQAKPSGGEAAKPSDSDSDKQAGQDTRKKVWVDPVYEEVYHEEVGHWETKTHTVTKVICGGTDHNPGDPNYDGPFGGPSPIFDDVSGWKAHQEAFIAEMRKDDPYYQCTGRHRPAKEIQVEESYDEWVVDEAAWTEQVLVTEGHWEYE